MLMVWKMSLGIAVFRNQLLPCVAALARKDGDMSTWKVPHTIETQDSRSLYRLSGGLALLGCSLMALSAWGLLLA